MYFLVEREPCFKRSRYVMKTELGERKVVYKDGDYTKVLRGSCIFEGDFVKVITKTGPVWIGKSAIISIK